MMTFYFASVALFTLTCPRLQELDLDSGVFWGLVCLVKVLYLKTSLMDPGYISKSDTQVLSTKRRVGPDCKLNVESLSLSFQPELSPVSGEESVVRDVKSDTTYSSNSESSEDPDERECEEIQVVERRYCVICEIEQPVRAKHCTECEKCVALHDHHCPWLGTCIGEKNRRFFYFYLVSQGALL